ncbi:MAG TPA: methyltransferase domain-containing protein [Cellvibrionaceae bacterium]
MKNNSYTVGDGIHAAPNSWTFGGEVWRSFDDHIRRSIPLYDQLHLIVTGFARELVPPGGMIYELGCSTGTLCRLLHQALPDARIIGVDAEPKMVSAAQNTGPSAISYHCADLREFQPEPCNMAILCYCLQFIPVVERPEILRRIYQQLQLGGALLLAEKVKRRDPVFDRLCRQVHHTFKLSQGYTTEEINSKDLSLEGVLVPLFDDENIALLKEAGFTSINPVFQNATFDAWLAIK